MYTGAVLFDDPESRTSGWACGSRDKYAVRIRSVTDLPSDTVWFMNLTNDEAFSTGLDQNAFYRQENYLPLRMKDIIQETGLTPSHLFQGANIENSIAVKMLADLFEMQVRVMCAVLGIERHNWRPHGFELKKTCREHLMPVDPRLDADIHLAIQEASQPWVSCDTRYLIKGHDYIRFHKPRIIHAQELLSTPIPLEPKYRYLGPNEVPKDRHSFAEWALSMNGPVLAKAVIHEMDDSIAAVVNYGGVAPTQMQARGNMLQTWRSGRQWFTTPDLLSISSKAVVEIKEAFVFEQSACKRLIDIPEVSRFFSSITELESISYSLNLFAHGLWTSLIANHARAMNRNVSLNIAAPFIRSVDRMLCMMSASELSNLGYGVSGYGVGKIHARLPEESETDILQACSVSGVYPTMLSDTPANAVCFEEDDSPWGIVMAMLSSGMTEDFFSVDQEITNDWLDRYSKVNTKATG